MYIVLYNYVEIHTAPWHPRERDMTLLKEVYPGQVLIIGGSRNAICFQMLARSEFVSPCNHPVLANMDASTCSFMLCVSKFQIFPLRSGPNWGWTSLEIVFAAFLVLEIILRMPGIQDLFGKKTNRSAQENTGHRSMRGVSSDFAVVFSCFCWPQIQDVFVVFKFCMAM